MRRDRIAAMSTRVGVVAILAAAAVAACNEYGIPAGTSPHREFNFLDMGDQPKVKAQRGNLLGGSDFMTPEGALPRGFDPYPYKGKPELAGEKLRNPLVSDQKTVERGKLMFERYCVPCHDATGAGKGKVVEKGFPAPPSLMTQKVRDWPDGRIYHVVTDGQNIMPSYATQIRPNDRWAAVHYVRSLQSQQPVAPPPENASPNKPAPVDTPAPEPAGSAAPAGSAEPAGSSPPAVPGSAAPSQPPGSPAPATSAEGDEV